MKLELNQEQIEDIELLIIKKLNQLKQDKQQNQKWSTSYDLEIQRYKELLKTIQEVE